MHNIISKKPVLIVGVGNLIQMDDGIGIHVIRELEKQELPDDVELFDGGTLGIDLMPWIEDRKILIFIDALESGYPPGTIFRFEPDDLEYDDMPKTSVHQLGLIDSLKMMSLTGKTPEKVIIFTVQPEIINWGENLTPEVSEAVPKVVKLVLKQLDELNEKISK